MKVFIFGAGMSGISTGLNLLQNGVKDVVIYESEKKAGGLSASFSWGNFEYNDYGPHIWHTPNDELSKEWEARCGNDLFKGDFRGANVIDPLPAKLVDYPLSKKTIDEFDFELKTRILKELKECTEESKIFATSFDEYVNALVGPTLTNMFFKEYPEKLWGIETSKMTANWAPKRIKFVDNPGNFHVDQWSAVGKYGSGQLIDNLLTEFLELGGIIRFESKITEINIEDYKIKNFVIHNNSVVNVSEGDRIVNTIPFHQFAQMLGIKNNLSYRGAHLVYLNLRQEFCIPDPYAFLYFPQKDIIFHRLSEQKKFCNFGWPVDQTTIVAEIAYSESTEKNFSSEKLTKKVIEGLIWSKFIEDSDTIIDTLCLSFPNVYPMLTRTNELEFNDILSKMRNFEQVYSIGTGGDFHYADLQILYHKGRDLAKRIISESTSYFPSSLKREYLSEVKGYFPTRPFVIAEIGLNHGGNIEIAKKLLDEAKNAGVKFVKFQTYRTESRISATYRANNYFEEVIGTEENLFQMFKKCEFSKGDWDNLFEYATNLNLNMFSAVFDKESLALLEEIGCPAYKVASMDVNNTPLLKEIAKTNKPVILSTGMSSLGEIEAAVNILSNSENKELIILHCVSSYPASVDSLNLKSIETLQSAFGFPVGFSDHSIGISAPIVAVAIGAIAIEKHFTLNKSMEGPDHIFSLEPDEMADLVRIVENIPLMLGSSKKTLFRQELDTAFKYKKSIHAKIKISRGDKFSRENLEIKGPGAGLPPEFWENLIGRKCQRDILPDYPITWEDI